MQPGHRFNPWTHLRNLAAPGDFVAIKLDFDAPELENTLVAQLLADEALLGLVDEMFYEHHVAVDGPDRPWSTRHGEHTITDSYRMFQTVGHVCFVVAPAAVGAIAYVWGCCLLSDAQARCAHALMAVSACLWHCTSTQYMGNRKVDMPHAHGAMMPLGIRHRMVAPTQSVLCR